MHDANGPDRLDLKLLAALQADAGASNHALAERIGLSASQVSRRRARLEAAGYIRGYRAALDPARLGFSVTAFVHVRLSTHSPGNAQRLRDLVARVPQVQEAHALTGDMDYLLKVIVTDLSALAALVNEVLLPHEAVDHVRSSIALETLKEGGGVPIAER